MELKNGTKLEKNNCDGVIVHLACGADLIIPEAIFDTVIIRGLARIAE